MPWQFYSDVDDTLGDWLSSQYTPYRNTLIPTSRLPLETDIDWDAYWAGVHETSFIVYEDTTDLGHLGLGSQESRVKRQQVVRVTHRWIGTGKSPFIKEFREFITRTIYENLVPLPAPSYCCWT